MGSAALYQSGSHPIYGTEGVGVLPPDTAGSLREPDAVSLAITQSCNWAQVSSCGSSAPKRVLRWARLRCTRAAATAGSLREPDAVSLACMQLCSNAYEISCERWALRRAPRWAWLRCTRAAATPIYDTEGAGTRAKGREPI